MSPLSNLFGFLFARPSFLEGVARLIDFGGVLNTYNVSESPKEADAIALRADWVIVGDDLWDAAETVAAEMTTDRRVRRQLAQVG